MVKYMFVALIYVMLYLFFTKGELKYAVGTVISALMSSILFFRE